MKRIRVLIVVEGLGVGGIETYVRGVCKYIDKGHFDISVLIVDSYNKGLPGDVADLEREGVRILLVNKKSYLKDATKYVRGADIVHFQVRLLWLMLLGRLFRKKIILHSHFGFTVMKVGRLKQWLMRAVSDLRLAPSASAGDWLFGQGAFTVVANGFDSHKFLFDVVRRRKARERFGIKEGEKVLLQIGRFGDNKNQLFSVEVLGKLIKNDSSYRLLAIGQQTDGRYVDRIKKTAKELGLTEDRVLLLTPENDPVPIYNASDLLVQPSRYEGLPYAVLEAQVNGLPCFVSDSVSSEVDISGRVMLLPIDKGTEVWADAIKSTNLRRSDMREAGMGSRYNIKNAVRELEKLYVGVVNG